MSFILLYTDNIRKHFSLCDHYSTVSCSVNKKFPALLDQLVDMIKHFPLCDHYSAVSCSVNKKFPAILLVNELVDSNPSAILDQLVDPNPPATYL